MMGFKMEGLALCSVVSGRLAERESDTTNKKPSPR